MRSLLIVAHGSRRHNSNEEVMVLARRVADLNVAGFTDVSAAFLELAQPSIPDGLQACITRGASAVVVFPYFLAAGRHVVEDIPAQVDPVVRRFPQVRVIITPHLGKALALPEVILQTAQGMDK